MEALGIYYIRGKEMEITKFFQDDYTNAALYQSFRSIGNFIDGFKPSSRKVFFTVDKNNVVTNTKVANLAADVSSKTQYIHGSASLEGVIIGMAQEFCNNYNLLEPEGSFGDRLNHSAAASRYIFTKKSKWFDKFFNEDDKKIIKYREFEGSSIEPFFYTPIVPFILLNGSSGIGNGYAQKILPRKLEDITKAITSILNGKEVKSITPWFRGFEGVVNHLPENKVEICGVIENNTTSILIKEVPYSYELIWYLGQLDKLVDSGVIKEYKDLSEDGKFKFDIKCTREFGKQEEKDILEQLKLIDRQTENFTCVSENDSIIVFSNEIELLKSFIKIRLEYYTKRKNYLLGLYKDQSLLLKNKIRFIESIMDNSLVIFKKSKETVEKLLIEQKYDKVDSSYEYLLEMRIDTFTKEKIDKMKAQLAAKELEYKELKAKSEKDLWIGDLSLIMNKK
jgi:DNA topoisomerase-2